MKTAVNETAHDLPEYMGEKSGELKSRERKIFFSNPKLFKKSKFFGKKIGILRNREKYPLALMRRTRIPNTLAGHEQL